jgi:nucleoside-diphosphate-sugar epimerase
LLTGAAGRIGTAFYAETADRPGYWFRLADRRTDHLSPRDGHEVVTLDIADLDACRAACEGIDAVLHLAADPSPEADFYGSLLENNITGAFNVFRAAKDAGARRVVFASSVHAVAGYPDDTPIPTDVPVRPLNLYGVSKCFGEALAHYFSAAERLSCIAVRIGAYDAPWIHANPTPRSLAAYVSPRDLNQLFVRALDASPDLMFAIANGQSDNRVNRLDLGSTEAVLGYAPQDDGFAIFGVEPDAPGPIA